MFFAAHQGSLRDIEFNPIIFNQVLVNQGSAYNNDTGIFTAPVAGIYQFVYAAQLCRGEHNNMWDIMVKGSRRLSCHGQVSSGGTSVNTCYLMQELKKGDLVWVRQRVGGCAWASSASTTITFSGVMLAREGVSALGEKYGSGSSCPLPFQDNRGALKSSAPGQTAALSSIGIMMLLRVIFLG
ncbi:complement C1q-like protein 4 [Antennarius striatus]|uniref:complement C1q-like protein 4 n=1 Tax=Antennarius striatus TaxID=241820 RepID=UPI0035B09542